VGLLDGQRAFITGAGSGIGRATARLMAAEGARVAVADIDGDAAEHVAKEIDGAAFHVDVTDTNALESAVRAAAETFDGLSIMFNNAGGGMLANVHDYSAELWEQLIRLNLTGVFNGIKAAAPGSIATKLTDPLWAVPGEQARAIEHTPLKRLGQPEDIAKVVVFLCSDLAAYITGQNIVVDGGMILHGSGVDGILTYLQSAMRGEPPRYY
jgi:NAD(P)-dependent dehydrogenase (short-subunit alcohol dehydrogenase family)